DALGGGLVVAAERVVHHREVAEGADERVGDDVGEGDLLAADGALGVVDEAAVLGHKLDRDLPRGGGRGDLEAGLHVVHEACGGAAERRERGALGRRRAGGLRRGLGPPGLGRGRRGRGRAVAPRLRGGGRAAGPLLRDGLGDGRARRGLGGGGRV